MKLKPLKKGDIIGIYSPSSPITSIGPNRFQRGKEYLKKKGFEILEGSLTGKRDFYRSGTIQERAEELNSLIRNPQVACIMSTIGGMNSNSLLPYLDYEAFLKHPKIMVGYSDVTAILLSIYEKTGISTFYGPALVASFGEFPPLVDETYQYFEDLLTNFRFPIFLENPSHWSEEFVDWESQNRAKKISPNDLISIKDGIVSGRLIGGNLNTMQGIWNTPYMPKIKKGDILFIEDSLKDAQTIERSFALLKLSGIFDQIGGLILGKHEKFDDQGSKREPYEILLEVLGEPKFPFLAQLDCCHTHPMMTLPIGGTVTLDAGAKKLSIDGF